MLGMLAVTTGLDLDVAAAISETFGLNALLSLLSLIHSLYIKSWLRAF